MFAPAMAKRSMRPSPSSASALWLVLLAGCPGSRTGGTTRCPTDRTVTLALQEDVERFAGCELASGLTIRTGATISLAPVQTLETITGDLLVGPTVGVDEISLRELREVGGSIQIESNGSLGGIFLPRLERAGRISIAGNAALTSISMPRLETVLGSLVISENGSLELVTLTGLVTVGKDLVLADNPKLSLVEANKLTTVLEVRVDNNRALPAEQVEALLARSRPKTP